MARKMNYDAAKRREWKAEARREKAMEIAHDDMVRQRNRDEWMQRPASEAQRRLVVKYGMHRHCGHDDSYLETMTVRQADMIIKKFGRDNGWKQKSKPRERNRRRREQPRYRPITSIFETQGTPDMSGPNVIRSKGPRTA